MNPNFNAALFHRGKKLTQNEVGDISDVCPVCLSEDARTALSVLQKDPDVSLLKCSVCGAISASRMPTENALESYYGSYYADNSSKVTFHNIDRFANHIYKLIQENSALQGELRILDYGGGNGSLGLSLAKKFEPTCKRIEVVLVDYNIEQPFTKEGIKFQSFRNLSEASGNFDIVLASAVLEHIPQLNAVLVELYAHLKGDGFFYARTPYMMPFKKMIKGLDLTYPAHVHDLGPAFWNTFSKPLHFSWQPIVSRASIVETQFENAFLRTLISYLCKFPSRMEERLNGKVLKRPKWKYVGGWEVVFKKQNK